MPARRLFALPLVLGLFVAPASAADKQVFTKVPASVKELKDLQQRVQEVYKRALPAVVGIQIGGAAGSGVIVTEDGYVLTAGHVSGKPDTECTVIFPDGKTVMAKSLGANKDIDSGMLKITEPGKWPHVDMGRSKDLQKGQWVVSLGHPGGYLPGRTPVLRLGRIVNANDRLIQTDCTLVGGDSGGPLFDLDGNVVGIHSRIGPALTFNIHVPIGTYQDTWDRLIAGESWGNTFGRGDTPARGFDLGARYEPAGGVLRIREVRSGSLAEKAGLKVKDLIMKVDGKTVSSTEQLDAILRKKKSGDEVTVEVDRGAERMSLKLTLKS